MLDDQEEDESMDDQSTPDGTSKKKSNSSKRQMPLRRTPRKRLIWTSELHNMFVETVNRLGAKAVPTTILHEMNVEGLSRENVASHLQKYRLQLKRLQRLRDQPHKGDDAAGGAGGSGAFPETGVVGGMPVNLNVVQPMNIMPPTMMMMSPNLKTVTRMPDKVCLRFSCLNESC